MDIFLHLFSNLLPLYVLIALGFIAGRYFEVERNTLANLAIFICVPVVGFGFVAKLDFKPSFILLPVIVYTVEGLVAWGGMIVGRYIYKDNRANLLAMCAAMGNKGYFGLPLVLLLFDAQWVGVYMFVLLGGVFFESTAGYYIAARGRFSVKDSLIKLAKFPSIYAIAAALVVNFSGIELSGQFDLYWGYFKGAYVVVGMMIIGAALSKIDKLVLAPRFMSLVFAGKFLAWPVIIGVFIVLDRMFFGLFVPEVHKLLIITSIVPPAANITAFAAQMDLRPEKAATTVVAGTVFALFYIPAVLIWSGFY